MGGKKSFSGEKQKKIKSNKPILLKQGAGGIIFQGLKAPETVFTTQEWAQ